MKKLFLLLLFWSVRIYGASDNWSWQVYKIQDNKVVAILFSEPDFKTEFSAKVNWLKYARFFNLTDDQFNFVK